MLKFTLFVFYVLLLLKLSHLASVKEKSIIASDETNIFSSELMKPVSCVNPNGRRGRCVSLEECEPLKSVLRQRLSKHYNFVRLCQCPGRSGKYPNVCCTSDTRFINLKAPSDRIIFPDDDIFLNLTRMTPDEINEVSKKTPKKVDDVDVEGVNELPKHCGQINMIDNRIYGGIPSGLNEFPWTVVLEYNRNRANCEHLAAIARNTCFSALNKAKEEEEEKIVLECGGSLINARYVLTAAHCIKGDIELKALKLESLRIGEYNTETLDDCDASGCRPRFQRLGIDHVIVHPNYRNNEIVAPNEKPHERHDIALIRMERVVEFTEYLQPICLPDITTPALEPGTNLTVAGWGHVGYAPRSAELLKVVVPLVSQEQCSQTYADKFSLGNEQLCAGGNFYEDSCSGDSGGPLMYLNSKNNYTWVLEGVVSFGFKCGLENHPAIYTRVRSYVPWIVKNVVNSFQT